MSSSFTINLGDLQKILEQIKIAERHAAGEDLAAIIGPDASLLPAGLRTVDGSFNHLLPGTTGSGAADNIFPRMLPAEYRTVNDNYQVVLVPAGAPGAPPGGVVITNNNYDPLLPGSHSVADADPRIISNLVVDQSNRNPAAIEAWFANEKSQAAYAAAHDGNPPPDGYIPTDEELSFILNASPDIGLSPGFNGWMTFFGQFFDHGLDLVTKGNAGTVYIPLQGDDPLYDKGADGLVNGAPGSTVNDDGFGADGVFGTADDRPNFMALSRGTLFVDPVTGKKTEMQNTTTPFVDQNQTYTSHASHQVFLREYSMVDLSTDSVAGPVPVSTGRLIDGATGAIGNWAEVKAQAKDMLGLTLGDYDVLDVPLLLTDPYGKFIPGAHGFPQVVVGVTVVDSVTGALISTATGNFTAEGVAGGLDLAHIDISQVQLPPGVTLPALPAGQQYKVTTVGTGHAFLNDIAHHAEPVLVDADHNPSTPKTQQTADDDRLDFNSDGVVNADDVTAALAAGANLTDVSGAGGTPDGVIDVNDLVDVNLDGVVNQADLIADDKNPLTYDNELLDAHFVTGDGRGNENIGLTAVHTIFHSEHNRLVEVNKDTIIASGDRAVINEWLLTPLGAGDPIPTTPAGIDALNWNGERLFQAARFVTEMQYQHLVFEEFARKIQPNVEPFVFTNSADLDPAIVAEFAHVVYRFGHSMLPNVVARLDNSLETVDGGDQIGLIEAFLNPQAFTDSGLTTADAAGSIIRGLTRQTGNEIDEFVVDAVRSNLLGLPLDLPALNIARGRDAGVPSLNHSRAQFYAATGDSQLKPYTSWFDYAENLKNQISIVNFIAAYGLHPTILAATTAADKRAAAMELVMGVEADGVTPSDIVDGADFINGTGAWNAANSGLDNVDLWIGGLAETKMEFGGMLGSTFNFVFETQLEHLQNGDRMYYLSRTQGMNLLNQLEPNTFTDLVMRNTALGDTNSTHLNGTLFDTADLILELDKNVAQEGDTFIGSTRVHHDPVWEDGRFHIGQKVTRTYGTTDVNGDGQIDGNTLKFLGGEHVVLGGTEGNDRLFGDKGIDTLWGDGGDDYLNAGSEADQVFGGDGDDIIEDFFGDGDFLRGNKGNDVISDSHGFGDVLFGDSGNDFILLGSDTVEVFAGEGDDFLLGGVGTDALMGNEGNDWLEGGEGFDTLSGENSDLFFNSPIIGHDVLDGQGNDTDYDGESGDDIMVQGPGIQRNNGMLGFDWSIGKGEEGGSEIDLGISQFLNQQALTLRDRNDSVEGVSGWKYNDTLIGTNAPTGAVGGVRGIVGGPETDSMLLSQNVALIRGLETLVKLMPAALRGQTVGVETAPFASLAKDTTVFNPQTGADIMLGGAGSDSIFGKAGNDLIDGDRWLNVRIEVHANKNGTGPLVTNLASVGTDGSVDSLNEIKSDMLAGRINPGQLQIVREIITTGAGVSDNDVAVYAGNRSDYTIVQNANGTTTVIDNVLTPILVVDPVTGEVLPDALLGDEGTDTLSNIEILRFTDRDGAGNATGTFTDVRIGQSPATGSPVIFDFNGGTPIEGQVLTTDISSIADGNGLGAFNFAWQVANVGTPPDGVWTNIANATGASFTPTQAQVGRILRFVTSFTDGAGHVETLISAPTPGVGDVFTGTAIADNVTLTPFDDIADGLGSNDVIIGLSGNDQLRGGVGDDTIEGGDGDDLIDGGAGNDLASYAGASAGVTVALVTGPQNTGGAGVDRLNLIERLTGSAFNDSLTGDANVNILTGGAGNDILDGLGGADRMIGGTGDDTYVVDSATDNTTELVGEGIDTVNTALTTIAFLQVNVENLNYTGTDNFSGSGNNENNVITSGVGNDTLVGGNGNDTLVGRGGTNSYNGNSGADLVLYNEATSGVIANLTTNIASANGFGATDTYLAIENLVGSAFADSLTGSGVANVFDGGAGNDTLLGLAGADILRGGLDNDSLNGGANDDVLDGGEGDDLITQLSTDGRDFVDGGAGRDTYQLNGTAAVENFVIYTRAAYLAASPSAVLNANTEIVLTRNGAVVGELDNVEEVGVNTLAVSANDGNGVPNGGLNSGDTITVVGDFTQTSLDYSTITINGSIANDTVDISGLTSDHRIVFNSGGGADKLIGTLRPQDVVDFMGSQDLGTNLNGQLPNEILAQFHDHMVSRIMPPDAVIEMLNQDRMTLSHHNILGDHHTDLM